MGFFTSTNESRTRAANGRRPSTAAEVHKSAPAAAAPQTAGRSTYYNQPILISATSAKPCLAATQTPRTYAHGPRQTHQDGPLYGYEAHASLLRAKLASYLADVKRIRWEWDEAATLLAKARRELDKLGGDERRVVSYSRERREWKREREGWLGECGWAEARIRKVRGEVRRKGYLGFDEGEEGRGVA